MLIRIFIRIFFLFLYSYYLYVLFVSDMFDKHQRENTENDKRQSDVDEAVLLKDWDFARFFPSKNTEKQEKHDTPKDAEQKRAQLQRQSRLEMEDAWSKYKAIATPPSRHKQLFQKPSEKSTQDKLSEILKYKKEQDSDVNSPNRFFRGFRRENSDLFPLPSTRHSAIYFPKHESPAGANKQLRSSGIFNNSRKQIIKPSAGEPILTDFIKTNDSLKMAAKGGKGEKRTPDRKIAASNPIDALKNVAALIRQDSESNGPSRQSSVNSDSPATSICFSSSTSFEKAGTPDLTANTLENKSIPDNVNETNMVKPRREKTESDIVFRRNSQYNRHSELMTSCGQEAVLAQDQVNCSLLRIV